MTEPGTGDNTPNKGPESEFERLIQGLRPTPEDSSQQTPVTATSKSLKSAGAKLYVTREKTFHGWVGTREQLLRIEHGIRQALEQSYEQYMRDKPDDLHKYMSATSAQDALPEATVTASTGNLKRTGELEAIFQEMDASEIQSIHIANPGLWSRERGYLKVNVSLGREEPSLFFGDKDVKVEVAGSDRQLVGGLFDLLSTEIGKGARWWSKLRQFFAGPFIGALLGVGALGVAFANGSDRERSTPSIVANAASMYFLLGVFVGLFVFRPLFRKHFPAAEVLEPGATPRGRQSLGLFVGIVSFGLSIAGVVLGVMAL